MKHRGCRVAFIDPDPEWPGNIFEHALLEDQQPESARGRDP